jgi:hypothetical protein
MKRVSILVMVALLAMLILVPMAVAQTPTPTPTPMASPAGQPPETGGPAIFLPAAALLLGSGILTYAILRRR